MALWQVGNRGGLTGRLAPLAARSAGWLLVLVCSSHFAAEGNGSAGDCGTASNCGGVGGWRLILLTAEPAPRLPDLLVERPSVVDSTLTTDQAFTLTTRVRNDGRAAAAATTLRWYRSTDRVISADDTEVGTDAVEALARGESGTERIEVRTPTGSGTFRYGACVEAVADEADTDNCSAAVEISVETRTDFFGAAATSVTTGSRWECSAGLAGTKKDTPAETIANADIADVRDDALDRCRAQGGRRCGVTDTWVRGCLGIAVGANRAAGECDVFHYGGDRSVTTLSGARSGALSLCRAVFGTCVTGAICDDGTTSSVPPRLGLGTRITN